MARLANPFTSRPQLAKGPGLTYDAAIEAGGDWRATHGGSPSGRFDGSPIIPPGAGEAADRREVNAPGKPA